MSANNETLKQRIQKIFNKVVEDLQKNHSQYWEYCKNYCLTYHNKKNAWGSCSYRTKSIKMSLYLNQKADDSHLEDTIRHEFAHAIQYERDGFSDGHGSRWKKVARSVGANDSSTAKASYKKILPSKYVMVLDIGNGEFEYIKAMHKKSKRKKLGHLEGLYLIGKKVQTENKLYMVTWAQYQEYVHEGMIASNK